MTSARITKYTLPNQLSSLLPFLEKGAPSVLKVERFDNTGRREGCSLLDTETLSLIRDFRTIFTSELEEFFWVWTRNGLPKKPSERNSIQVILDLLGLERALYDTEKATNPSETITESNRLTPVNYGSLQGRSYIYDLAEKYKLLCDRDIDNVFEKLSPSEINILKMFANTVKSKGDYEWVNEYLFSHPMEYHESSCWIYFLFGLLDKLGLRFDG